MSKGTPTKKFRIEDELWDAAQAKKDTSGPDVSTVLREAIKAWLGHPDAQYDLFTPPTHRTPQSDQR
jgi:hypothetical protein